MVGITQENRDLTQRLRLLAEETKEMAGKLQGLTENTASDGAIISVITVVSGVCLPGSFMAVRSRLQFGKRFFRTFFSKPTNCTYQNQDVGFPYCHQKWVHFPWHVAATGMDPRDAKELVDEVISNAEQTASLGNFTYSFWKHSGLMKIWTKPE